MLEHGGRLHAASKQYGIPLHEWLDLSTGINPQGWPVPELPRAVWNRLPEEEDGLEAAAAAYYQCEHLLAVAGSQAAIQALPRVRPPSRVTVLHPAYAEHAAAWARAGHTVQQIPAEQIESTLEQSDVLILLNPVNPTGIRFTTEQLRGWQQRLAQHAGWLIVDEAFIDATPEASLIPLGTRPGLIVLRSLGKFFGLAGARVGFVCAEAELLHPLREHLGPWTISHPARHIARLALQDHAWQAAERPRLLASSQRLQQLLTRHQLPPSGGTALFQWVTTARAGVLQQTLARRGIWVRQFAQPSGLRFGLPATEPEWARLEHALQEARP